MKHYCTLLVFLLFSTTIFSQSTLQYKLKKGDVFHIKQDAEQVITQEMNGMSHEISNNMGGVFKFEITAIENKNYHIKISFQDLTLKATSNLQGVVMNIEAKNVVEGDMQSNIFHSLLNVPITAIMTPTGDILEIKGADKLINKMMDGAGIEDSMTKEMMKKSLEKSYSSTGLSNSFEQMTFIYPEAAVNIGDSWENSFSGDLQAKNTWTLKALSSSEATIEGEATIAMKTSEQGMTMELNGSQSYTLTTNAKNGFLKTLQVKSTAKGDSTIPQLGTTTIPTTLKSTTTYTLIQE